MFKRIKKRKGDGIIFNSTLRYFHKPDTQNLKLPQAVEFHIGKLFLSLDSQIKRTQQEFETMVHAVEWTMYQELLNASYKVKAIDKLLHENKVHSKIFIALPDGRTIGIKDLFYETTNKVFKLSNELPDTYADLLGNILSSPAFPHWSKISKYMPINKPVNFVDDLYSRLSNAPYFFRQEVCASCGWSLSMFFHRIRRTILKRNKRAYFNPSCSEAEAEKIIMIFKKLIIPSLLDACLKWEKIFKVQNENRKEEYDHVILKYKKGGKYYYF